MVMEERIREKVVRAVSDILKSAGYEVHHAPPPIDLSAVSGSVYLVIICSNDHEEVSRFSETEFTFKGDEGDRKCIKLVITFDQEIETPDSLIWYTEDFIRYSGESVFSRIVGRQLILPIDGSDTGTGGTGLDERGGNEVRIPHLPVRIGRENAEEKAGVPGVATLKFIPYWLFRYTSRGSAGFKDQVVSFDSSGSGAFNAINGSLTEVDPDAITRRSIPQGSEVFKPQIDENAADERIIGDIIQKMTRKIKARQIKGDAIYYEEKKVAPDRSNIELEIRELYIPVWQIKGKKIVEINAYTGERLREPMDDGVEVL